MYRYPLIPFLLFTLLRFDGLGQADTSFQSNVGAIPARYFTTLDKKIDKYSTRLTKKTEKTLTRLSHWEGKIKNILQKASPQTAEQLFGNNQPTFTSLLQQYKKGEALALCYKAPYNKYRDDVTTSLKYLTDKKQELDSGLLKKANNASASMKELAGEEDKSAALQQFIQQRKKQLFGQAL